MKILAIDCETTPNLAYVWSLWKQNVAINQIKQPGEILCWAARWIGSKKMLFDSGPDRIRNAWELLDEADAVVHYNGTDFDIPNFNREFLQAGLKPPSPFKEIDLLKVARKRFAFPSNKLEYVSQALGIGQKVKHTGFELWLGCMKGDPKAWRLMEKYNRQDVALLETLYAKLLPWIEGHPNVALFDDARVPSCPNCGGTRLRNKGYHYTATQAYRRWHCRDCGAYPRERFTAVPKEQRKVILTQAR